MSKKGMAVILFICMSIWAPGLVWGQKGDVIQEAKQGVVEIYSGLITDDGVFHQMNQGSGFVIYNEEDSAYVVTTRRTAVSSEKERKAYCKKNEIATDNFSLQEAIRVVVKGDVTVEAALLTESAEQNYAVLQVDGSISERLPLKLAAAKMLVTGDTVYALGFADGAGTDDTRVGTEFSAMDVEIREGTVQDVKANQNGVFYIQHSAAVSGGNTGGPLLNEDGYVVGLNDAALGGDGAAASYSLPVEEIREVLDNFQIDYGSREKEEARNDFEQALAQARELMESKEYKASSKEALEEAVRSAEEAQTEDIGEKELGAITGRLQEAQAQLERNMPVTRKVVLVLGAVIALLFIWLMTLVVWKVGAKKRTASREKGNAQRDSVGAREASSTATAAEESRIREDAGTQPGVYGESDGAAKRQGWEGGKRDRAWERADWDEGEGTVLLGEDGPAGVFPAGFRMRKQTAVLNRLDTGEVFRMEKPQLDIGKKAGVNDLVVTGNSAVSRQHARIFWEENEYYILDLGSANGTFVNSVQLDADIRKRLKDGDTVVLADERFSFTLENHRR